MRPCSMPFWFQSAPLTDVRGDGELPEGVILLATFQSAPLTDVRGDPRWPQAVTRPRMFQSAPLTDVRGDFRLRAVRGHNQSFNPLPSLM